jgi:hypothetical protein
MARTVNTVRLVCAQCGDVHTVPSDGLHCVRHWCWQDAATGLWCSMGRSVDE